MTTDILDLAAADAAAPPEDITEGLGQISKVALRLRKLQGDLERNETAGKAIQESIDAIQEKELPEIMRRYKMATFKLDDGSTISVEAKVYSHIKEENREAAHKWLRDNGFADLIKTNVSLSFGKGEAETVDGLTKMLGEAGYSYVSKDSVNANTLSAFVREQVKKGQSPPVDLFGIFSGDVAEVKTKKGAKS